MCERLGARLAVAERGLRRVRVVQSHAVETKQPHSAQRCWPEMTRTQPQRMRDFGLDFQAADIEHTPSLRCRIVNQFEFVAIDQRVDSRSG